MFTFPIILASKSQRRQELLKLMGIEYQLVEKEVDESYPEDLKSEEIAGFIARQKAEAFLKESEDAVVITADTIVSVNGRILGKPADQLEAIEMISLLSGKMHQVFTSVCLVYKQQVKEFTDVSSVYFRNLSADDIQYYVSTGKPLDKAGAYGIQEWIGLVAIERIDGAYTTVVGLPTHLLYKELQQIQKQFGS